MRNRRVRLFCAAVLAVAFAAVGCGKRSGSEVVGTSAENRVAESAASIAAAPGSAESSSAAAGSNAVATKKRALVSVEVETYQKDNVSIGYPVVNGLTDNAQQERLNAYLKESTLSPVEALLTDAAKGKLTVAAEAVSTDVNRVMVVYRDEMQQSSDAALVKLSYIDTVAVRTLKDLGLRDAVDVDSMMNHAPGDAFESDSAGESKVNAYKTWMQSTGKEVLQKSFEEKLAVSDFPLKEGENGKLQWPENFSYVRDGKIYFSVSVPQDMGGVVVMKYDMVTK